MMAERGSNIRPGYVLEHNGELYLVVKTSHTQPGKGGAYIQAEMKNINTGTKYYERFRADGEIRRVILDEQEYVYIFADGDVMTLMDPDNYEQIVVNIDKLGSKKIYLKENMRVNIRSHNGGVISASVPDHVVLAVVEADAVIKGQTASSSYKPAVLENGLKINVPPFIKSGDKIVVYTPDDSYYERAKEE